MTEEVRRYDSQAVARCIVKVLLDAEADPVVTNEAADFLR